MIEGLQGRMGTRQFLAPGRVVATPKHFVGDDGTPRVAGGLDLARVAAPVTTQTAGKLGLTISSIRIADAASGVCPA